MSTDWMDEPLTIQADREGHKDWERERPDPDTRWDVWDELADDERRETWEQQRAAWR